MMVPIPRISETGCYEMSDEQYLADPCIEPSLNNSTITKLLVSPAHAFASHPRLGMAPDAAGDSTVAQDIGHIAHKMFLHGEDACRILNVPNFLTNRAKEMRAQAIADGRIPLKLDQYENVRRIVDKLENFRRETGAFTQGKPEQTLIWKEGAEWGRCKVDWLPDERSAYLWDLKTTGDLASADKFARSPFGYDTQAVYYPRGCECVFGEPPEGTRYCQIENKLPYGIRVFEFSPPAIDDALEQVAEGIALWARCRERGEWPGYPVDVEWIDIPPWKLRERAFRRQTGRGLARPALDPALMELMEKAGQLGG